MLTNLDAALCKDELTTHPLDAEDLALLLEALEDDLRGLGLPDERPDDLLDLDLDLEPDNLHDLDLLAEPLVALPVLDLVTQLLTPDLLPWTSDADLLDDLAATDSILDEDDFLEPELDDSSRNLEEEPNTLDEDDEPSLESISRLALTHLDEDLEVDLDPEPDFEGTPDAVLDEELPLATALGADAEADLEAGADLATKAQAASISSSRTPTGARSSTT